MSKAPPPPIIEGADVKRYVFWRMPNGKPHREQNDKYAPCKVLDAIGTPANTSGGGIQWPGFATQRFQVVLRSAVIVLDPDGDEINETDAWTIVWSAVTALLKKEGGGKPIQASKLLQEADRKAAEFFRKPENVYVMVTTLSVKDLPALRVDVRGSIISGLRSRGKRYPYPEVVSNAYPRIAEKAAKYKGKCVKITTKGRTMFEAANNSMANLGLLRGLWTLFIQYGAWSLSFGGAREKRLGVIHAGPIHTLHNPDGSLVADLFWYEASFESPFDLYVPSDGWAKIEKHRRWAMRRLKSLPYRRDLEDLLVRYAAALDQADLDLAFIKLWSILEKLTDTVGANYEETVRRAVWVYDEPQLAAEMLGAMRTHRNRLVHSSQSADQRDQVAYMVKSFVEPHLLRLLRNDFQVSSLEEYGRLLALPSNLTELKKQQQRLGRAVRFFSRDQKK